MAINPAGFSLDQLQARKTEKDAKGENTAYLKFQIDNFNAVDAGGDRNSKVNENETTNYIKANGATLDLLKSWKEKLTQPSPWLDYKIDNFAAMKGTDDKVSDVEAETYLRANGETKSLIEAQRDQALADGKSTAWLDYKIANFDAMKGTDNKVSKSEAETYLASKGESKALLEAQKAQLLADGKSTAWLDYKINNFDAIDKDADGKVSKTEALDLWASKGETKDLLTAQKAKALADGKSTAWLDYKINNFDAMKGTDDKVSKTEAETYWVSNGETKTLLEAQKAKAQAEGKSTAWLDYKINNFDAIKGTDDKVSKTEAETYWASKGETKTLLEAQKAKAQAEGKSTAWLDYKINNFDAMKGTDDKVSKTEAEALLNTKGETKALLEAQRDKALADGQSTAWLDYKIDNFAEIDEDADGKVSKAETEKFQGIKGNTTSQLGAQRAKALTDGKPVAWLNYKINNFDSIDTNSDNKVSNSEAEIFLNANGETKALLQDEKTKALADGKSTAWLDYKIANFDAIKGSNDKVNKTEAETFLVSKGESKALLEAQKAQAQADGKSTAWLDYKIANFDAIKGTDDKVNKTEAETFLISKGESKALLEAQKAQSQADGKSTAWLDYKIANFDAIKGTDDKVSKAEAEAYLISKGESKDLLQAQRDKAIADGKSTAWLDYKIANFDAIKGTDDKVSKAEAEAYLASKGESKDLLQAQRDKAIADGKSTAWLDYKIANFDAMKGTDGKVSTDEANNYLQANGESKALLEAEKAAAEAQGKPTAWLDYKIANFTAIDTNSDGKANETEALNHLRNTYITSGISKDLLEEQQIKATAEGKNTAWLDYRINNFVNIDSNADGKVNDAESQAYLRAKGATKDLLEAQRDQSLTNFKPTAWLDYKIGNFAEMDSNADGKVNETEAVAGMENIGLTKDELNSFKTQAIAEGKTTWRYDYQIENFDAIDTNADGKVTKAEVDASM